LRASRRTGPAFEEMLRFAGFLTGQARAEGIVLDAEETRAAVLARLSIVLPPHHELAVATALDCFSAGRTAEAVAAFGAGPDGDLLALHSLAAYTAALGTLLFAPGEFTAASVLVLGGLIDPAGPDQDGPDPGRSDQHGPDLP
jgi:hypothetical protein